MTELKKCPFCKEVPSSFCSSHRYDPKTSHERDGKLYIPTLTVRCGCGCSKTVDVDHNDPYGETAYEKAIAAWNTRAVDEENQRLRSLLSYAEDHMQSFDKDVAAELREALKGESDA